jgi:hypothetical protein
MVRGWKDVETKGVDLDSVFAELGLSIQANVNVYGSPTDIVVTCAATGKALRLVGDFGLKVQRPVDPNGEAA